MPRSSKSVERRMQIVQALKAVMARKGYESASIQMIAAEADLAPGLVHYHFKSKQEILAELVVQLAERFEKRLEEKLAGSPSTPAERLGTMIDAWLSLEDGLQPDPEALACWVMIGGEALRQPQIRELYQQYLGRAIEGFEGAIGELLDEKGCAVERAPAMAAAIMAAIEGYFQLASVAPERIPTGSAASTLRHMVEAALLADLGEEAAP